MVSADWDEIERYAGELAKIAGDRIQGLTDALNDFLAAGTARDSGRIIEQHPDLLIDQIDRLLTRFIVEADQAGQQDDAAHLRERQRYLASYRGLASGGQEPGDSSGVPAVSPQRKFGECDPSGHIWEHSIVSDPGYDATVMRCQRCHVGSLYEFSAELDGIHVGCGIFPADDSDTVSPDLVRFFLLLNDDTIKGMESQRLVVRRETPTINWRPDALARHVNYTTGE